MRKNSTAAVLFSVPCGFGTFKKKNKKNMANQTNIQF